MLCKNCQQDSDDKVFCDKKCQKEYNKKVEIKIKERDKLPYNYQQALSYVYHTLLHPSENQLKETARYYDCDFKCLNELLHLAEYCKEVSLYKREIILSKRQISIKRSYEQKRIANLENVC